MSEFNLKGNRQVQRTRDILKKCFIKLMEEKEYKKITVTDIVRRAGYNRTTFYLHYKYKEELVHELIDDMLQGFVRSFGKSFEMNTDYELSSSEVNIFHFILINQDFFKLWTGSNHLPGFHEKLLQTVETLLRERLAIHSKTGFHTIKSNLFVSFLTYGTTGLLYKWIKEDFPSSPEYMEKQLLEIFGSVKPTY